MHGMEWSPAAALQHYFEQKSHTPLRGAAVPLLLPLLPQAEPAGGTWGLSSAQGQWGKELFVLAVVIFHLAGGKEVKQVK